MSEIQSNPTPMQASFPPGQHLRCESCGAEVAIIKPCTCQPPDQILKCCGKEMSPTG